MATIKDVAKLAEVSVATVSRVINNRGYLSDTVKEKVAQAMKELDYHPNDLARSLHNQKSYIIGLIVPAVSHPFFGEVAQYVEQYAYENGYKVLICNSLRNSDKEREYIEMLKRSQVDGIVMGSHVQDTEDYQDLRLPVISLDRQLSETMPYICCDNYQGGVLATRHLLDKGCRELLHISGSLEVKMLSNKRTEAFLDICGEAGVKYHTYELPDSAVTHFDEDAFVRTLLEKHPQVDGVFATSDVTAAAVISQATQLGRRVPEDLKVVGFDGSMISRLTTPRITSVKQPVDAIGRYVVEYMIRMMDGEFVPVKTMLPVTLEEAESTQVKE